MNEQTQLHNLLVVDDEKEILASIKRTFFDTKINVFVANSGEEAIAILKSEDIQVIISDQRMPEMSGSEFLILARAIAPDAIRIIISGQTDFESLKKAINQAVIHKFISKPWNTEELEHTVQKSFDLYYQRMSNRRVVEYFLHTKNGIAVIDRNLYVTRVNPALEKILGASEREVLGQKLTALLPVDIQQTLQSLVEQIGESKTQVNEAFECTFKAEDGSERFYSVDMTGTVDFQTEQYNYVLTLNDISKQIQGQREIEHQALHDELTGLPNRRLFAQRCEEALSVAAGHDWLAAILYFDLDKFKQINDTLGHGVGDEVLKEFARRVGDALRAEDTVSRFGGDEFVALLPVVPDEKQVCMIAERILDAFAVPAHIEGNKIFIGTSLGVALYPRCGTTVDALLDAADKALYEAKSAGRGNYQIAK